MRAPFRSFESHRRALLLHCYRMLGSLHEAEEIVQETLLRAWQHQNEVGAPDSARAWLYKVATNASLDLLKGRRRRASRHALVPASNATVPLRSSSNEHPWLEPLPDPVLQLPDDAERGPEARVALRESVGLAFIAALQFLSPRQRAALLLVDVLGWGPEETAALLETSVASVNSLLQRARAGVERRRGDGEHATASRIGDAEVLQRYVAMWESGDLDGFTSLLADDARLSMPPQPDWFVGRSAIRQFFTRMLEAQREYRFVPLGANGQPAIAVYSRPRGQRVPYQAAGITVFGIHGKRIAELTRFTSPELVTRFGLAVQLDGEISG